MRAALLQLCSGDDPAANLVTTREHVGRAVAEGAEFVLSPEVTNCVSASRRHQDRVLQREAEDQTLAGMRDCAARHGIWLLIGSLALKTDDRDGRYANRSFLLDPRGEIVARYDKMHMFDVTVSARETYRESRGYRPGDRAVLARTEIGDIGLTICYDVRFAYLYRSLAQAGAQIITVPSAFSKVTGAAHWEPLLRARAIETGAWILAPAQVGRHATREGAERETYGHGLVVSPWGEVIVDAGTAPGVVPFDLDLSLVKQARQRIPSLSHDRQFTGP